MSYRNACYGIIAATALGACAVDEGAEEEFTTQTQAAVGVDLEIRLKQLRSYALNENADEIYMTAKAATQAGQNVIRPSGSPDYWLFESAPYTRTMDKRVGQLKADGTLVTIKLWEQDTDPDDRLCLFDVYQNNLGFIVFVETQSATYLGVDALNRHVVHCNDPIEDGEYRIYLDI